MTTFDDRERAFETKFAHDAAMQFRATSRRNRLVALWAAELMGKSSDEAADYAAELQRADMAAPGQDDLLRRLTADLDGRADEQTIRGRMELCLDEARAQILAEI
ncbi:DUF1476 domain-containing protein [Frigidibacter sp. MR17.14]|uniref:DUF1476 domain-containing protein n=1 Tax=Frigidibacter sp. MR17.14 TaxID=3126509 RepID=UPI003012A57D